ncbi:hypothetical protein [Mycobacterium asiaticum]|uniref:hypothetical protein n=1 Tax=Mycobacterium asiaticum TaxID=1790 RepID=UPI0007EEF808|nr:hypothetical protein [Mycobacterium asiaticum]OBI97002.1 hypothetical protein A5661_18515 [Mycobacterium asiaticum]
MGICELTGRYSNRLRVEYSLQRVNDVASILGGSEIREHSVIPDEGRDLCHLSFGWLFRIFSFLDPLVAFFSEARQLTPEAQHAFVGNTVGSFFCRILLRVLVCLIGASPKGIANVVGRQTSLSRECSGLSCV